MKKRFLTLSSTVAIFALSIAALFFMTGQATQVSAESAVAFPVIADFEGGLPADWFVYGGETPAAEVVSMDGSDVLSVTYNVSSFGGFGAIPPSTDWTAYDAFSFDFYGSNSGTTYMIELQDGNGAVLERFVSTFDDNFDGWQTIVMPFADFTRSTGYQDPGAPDDGFQLDNVANWVVPLPLTSGTLKMDNLEVVKLNAFPIIANFEGGFPADWFVYGGETPAAEVVSMDGSDVLSVTYNVSSFGGFGAVPPQTNWGDYEAFAFDFYGSNSGTTYTIELQDGTGAVLERFHSFFVDDFDGWQTFVMPFANFTRSTGYQDPGAPDDGFQLDNVANWVVPLPFASDSFKMDNLQLVNLAAWADFEGGVSAEWFEYGGALSTVVATVPEGDPFALPGQIGSNDILSGTFDISGFGGFGENFVPARDWSELDGVAYQFYGKNSGLTYALEIQDGTPGLGVDRYRAYFVDNFDGWQQLVFPWDSFVFDGFQDGAPQDGFNKNEIRAWAYNLPVGQGSYVIDNMVAYGDLGNVTLAAAFENADYSVDEGETVTISVMLNAESTETVTVTYATVDGSAIAGTDYTTATGQLVFPAGETAQTFTVETIDDDRNDGDLTVNLTLSDPVNAELGTLSAATLTINDNEMATPSGKGEIIEDFESGELVMGEDADGNIVGYEFFQGGASTVAITLTTSPPEPVPGAADGNTVLQEDLFVTAGSFAGFSYNFTNEAADEWVPQDWSSYAGIGFWLYGNNTGGVIFIDIKDNRNPGSTTDDAGRYSIDLQDDFTGWQYFELMWDEFNAKPIGNGAPNDGFTLTEINGYAFGGFGSQPINNSYYIDDVRLLKRVDVIDDFEDGTLPTGQDADGIPVGFYTVAGGGGAINTSITNTPVEQVPGAPASNNVLVEDMTLPPNAFAVNVHAFSNETLDEWVPVDWSGYEGVCFWLYGHNTGGVLFLDVLDNRNPDSTTDDAGRYSVDIADDFSGWQFFQFTWDQLAFKDIGNGAPQDGLTLDEIHGYAIGGFGSVDMGQNEYYVDDFAVWGSSGADTPVTMQYAQGNYEVTEGGTATITVKLSRATDQDVTVDYTTAESFAIPNRDFVPTAGTLTIEAGQTSGEFTIETINNDKHDGDKSLMIDLSSPTNGELGFLIKTRLTVVDNDSAAQQLVNDFEVYNPFAKNGNITVAIEELASGDANAVPGQGAYENVLDVTYDTANGPVSLVNTFAEPVDWTPYQGMTFWFYGSNSGETYTVEVLDNQFESTVDTTADEWTLVWADEFDGAAGTQPNSDDWWFELGDGLLNGITGWGNGEFQYYTDDPANVSMNGAGDLAITLLEVDQDTSDLVCFYGPCQYTSARILTKGRTDFEYGRLEARIKVPDGPDGLWPAFWTLGADIDEVGWPVTGEIDIMEYVSRVPNEIFGTIHGPGYSGGGAYGNTVDVGEPVSNDYHVYAVEWNEDIIRWYFDGQGIGQGNNYHNATPDDVPGDWAFNDDPFFILLNMAIGGNFGGAISDQMTFPQTMLVDYVRVYQAPNSAERFETTFVDDFTGWQEVTVAFDDFTRSADQPANAPDDGLGLNEVWGYGLHMPEDAGRVAGNFKIDEVLVIDLLPTSVNQAETGGYVAEANWLVPMLLVVIAGGLFIMLIRRKESAV